MGARDEMIETASITPLLERCQQQDRTAFAELFTQFHRRVFATAVYITHSEDAADDITQLVFVELFSAFRRFDLTRPFLPWLYRIVHNVSVDYLRRHRRNQAAPLSAVKGQLDAILGADRDPGPAEQFERAELGQVIWRALEALPVKQRAVLVLRYYGGLNEPELAEALGCRRGTIKSRLHRAHRALAAELADNCGVSMPWDTDTVSIAAVVY
jgi:RNA polymerase sigma-70 factor (ECF subfamily)